MRLRPACQIRPSPWRRFIAAYEVSRSLERGRIPSLRRAISAAVRSR